EQIQLLPAERVGNVEQVADVLPKVVPRVGRTEAALPVAREIERNRVRALEERREQVEARGVVEPAVQCEERYAALTAPLARCERKPGHRKTTFDGGLPRHAGRHR